ncbi:hypothetical protein WDZ92_48240, partial [Nostoc sp. NIES-2111]
MASVTDVQTGTPGATGSNARRRGEAGGPGGPGGAATSTVVDGLTGGEGNDALTLLGQASGGKGGKGGSGNSGVLSQGGEGGRGGNAVQQIGSWTSSGREWTTVTTARLEGGLGADTLTVASSAVGGEPGLPGSRRGPAGWQTGTAASLVAAQVLGGAGTDTINVTGAATGLDATLIADLAVDGGTDADRISLNYSAQGVGAPQQYWTPTTARVTMTGTVDGGAGDDAVTR